jgi:hypothetical protein
MQRLAKPVLAAYAKESGAEEIMTNVQAIQ